MLVILRLKSIVGFFDLKSSVVILWSESSGVIFRSKKQWGLYCEPRKRSVGLYSGLESSVGLYHKPKKQWWLYSGLKSSGGYILV